MKHPSDDMEGDNMEISLGERLCLSCKAVGIPSPSYKWCHDDIELQEHQSHELDIVVNR